MSASRPVTHTSTRHVVAAVRVHASEEGEDLRAARIGAGATRVHAHAVHVAALADATHRRAGAPAPAPAWPTRRRRSYSEARRKSSTPATWHREALGLRTGLASHLVEALRQQCSRRASLPTSTPRFSTPGVRQLSPPPTSPLTLLPPFREALGSSHHASSAPSVTPGPSAQVGGGMVFSFLEQPANEYAYAPLPLPLTSSMPVCSRLTRVPASAQNPREASRVPEAEEAVGKHAHRQVLHAEPGDRLGHHRRRPRLELQCAETSGLRYE